MQPSALPLLSYSDFAAGTFIEVLGLKMPSLIDISVCLLEIMFVGVCVCECVLSLVR